MLTHRGVEIKIIETEKFSKTEIMKDGGISQQYEVSSAGRIFYVAKSKYGTNFGFYGPRVLNDAKHLIDVGMK